MSRRPTIDLAQLMALEGVPSALASARDGVDALLRDRGHRRTTPELTAESLMRGAAASASLEGSSTRLDDLRSGEPDALATAAARLNADLLSLVRVIARSPLQALARMHTLAAVGMVSDDMLGRPTSGDEPGASLQPLARLLSVETGLPAIAVAAVAHAEICTVSPFAAANGLVARALERLVLVARGVDPTSVTVPEAGHLAAEHGYRSALAAYAEGGPDGQRAWLLHASSAIVRGAELSPLVHDWD